ncbi:aspartate/glutamate racemase family protein [Falsiroseomonas sp. HC035]|uniref:aspartate/glutamate racemase family protein n=1 Tax=Falsiroseomonas sp. HC035 TaxID=3390999 RepID=UPI003D31E13D
MRIALIHALRHSPPPIEAAFAEHWPQARLMNLLDDSLSADLARDGALTPAMTDRFLALGRYAHGTGVQGVLFSCSAFGPCIEAVAADLAPIPVLKPNEAAIGEAMAVGRRIGLLASFPGTLASMPPEFPPDVTVVPCLAEGALAALDAGDGATHDRLAAEAAKALADCDVILLGQFSLARAARAVTDATGLPVVTTPGSAVRRLKAMLAG